MNIVLTFDNRNASIEPVGFRTVIQSVVDFFNGTYSDNVRINIDVGYGFVGRTNQVATLGNSLTQTVSGFSYSTLKTALSAEHKTANDTTAVASLPGSDPFNLGTQWTVSRALVKALGLSAAGVSANDTTLDGSIGIGTGFVYDTDRSNGISPGSFDLYAVFAHELTECLGRGLNQSGNSIEDLFKYSDSAGHAHTNSGSTLGYFSIDRGITNLGSYNTNTRGDFGDWADQADTPGASNYLGNDSFNAFSSPSVKNEVSEADLTKLDILGYDRQPPGITPTVSSHLIPILIGMAGDVGIYRLDLAASGLSAIQSITVHDDNIVSGGTGGASGFDLDFIELSNTATVSAATAASFLPGLSRFDFSDTGVIFQSGSMQPWNSSDPSFWNTTQLFGAAANQQYGQSLATLDMLDGSNATATGAISLGEGGGITFKLTQSLSTQGAFLYFGDVGGGNDGNYVVVSSGSTQPQPAGITLTGTPGNDDLRLGVGANVNLGAGNDAINGLAGNDLIGGAGGDDILNGGPGNDTIDGGPGADSAIFSGPRSSYTIPALGVNSIQVSGIDGLDTLINVERLFFDDQTVSLVPRLVLSAFSPGAGGWSGENQYPRAVADVTGDGLADIIGFGYAGVWVSSATGGGDFAQPALTLNSFGTVAGGWIGQDQYPRELADVNGDGRADIVGFGYAGAWVSLATGGGNFATPFLSLNNFGTAAGGWVSENQYPRELADVNGDGRADIVGFGYAGAWVSLATGGGNFATPVLALQNFGTAAGGWISQDQYPRELADVNGDGRGDIVGFGYAGVTVARGGSEGTFDPPNFNFNNFGAAESAGGWTSDDPYPRGLADVTGDHKADIVGFGASGVYVAQSQDPFGFFTG